MSIFLVTTLWLLQVFSSVSGYQVRRTGTTVVYSNTSSSVSSSSATCTDCEVGDPQNNIVEFNWPEVSWSSTEVATVVYEVNTILNVTVITTEYAELTGVGTGGTLSLASNDASFWDSLLGTTGVVVVDGTPTLTLKPTIYTNPGAFITVTAVVTSPTNYFNMGFLAYLITSTANPSPLAATDSCAAAPASTFGVTPTAILPGYNDPYQVPLDILAWDALIPQELGSCTTIGPVFGVSAVQVVSALTATTTIYDNNVHAPKTSPTPQNSPVSSGTSPQPIQAPTVISTPRSTTSQAPTHQSTGQTSAKVSSPATSQRPSPSGVSTSGPAPAAGSTTPKSSAQETQQESIAAPAPQFTASTLASQNPSNTLTRGSPSASASPLPTTAQPLNPSNTVSAPTPSSSPVVVVNGQTVSPGASAVTISGTPLSLAPSSSLLVVGTKTYTLGASPTTIALGSLTVTLAAVTTSAAPIVVNGQTLSAGASAITVDGTRISLAPSSSLIVVGTMTYTPGAGSSGIVIGSSTIAVVGSETTPATSGGIGSLIWSGIGGSMTASSSSTPSVATFTGAAPTLHVPTPFSLLAWLARWILGTVSI